MTVSRPLVFLFVVPLLLVVSAHATSAAPVVPGTGVKLQNVGDDFEDEGWTFHANLPKSSKEQDERTRLPAGRSSNGRWYEGIKRGCPDWVQRVSTPEGGLAGSQGALLLRTVQSGVPGRLSYQMQQDDFVANVWQRVGGKIPVQYTPSSVVRVFMPPIDTWENRSGPTFGYRVSLETHTWKVPEDSKWVKKKEYVAEPYWPGMFVELRSENDRGREYDSAYWRIRGNTRGAEVRGPQIDVTGWWTLGMSVTPDGMVHYYIRKGVEDLTAEDYVTSQFPYGYRAEKFKTFFFNVCNRDDGSTKSTAWIIDDAEMFVATAPASMAQRGNAQSRK